MGMSSSSATALWKELVATHCQPRWTPVVDFTRDRGPVFLCSGVCNVLAPPRGLGRARWQTHTQELGLFTVLLPPSLPAFPVLRDLAFFQSCCAYTMQKAKLVFRFCSLPPKAAYPAALERNPFCTSWQRVRLPGTSGRLEDPLIPAVVAGLQGEDAGLSQTSDRHFGIPCWIRAWSSWEVLSWPSVSIFLLHLNIEIEVAVIRLHLALFWGTPRAHYTF